MLKAKTDPKTNWESVHKYMNKEGIERSFQANREYVLAKDQYSATLHDNFIALAVAIRDRLIERWIMTQQRYHKQNLKRVYYLSLEFLIGRLLGTNIQNLGLTFDAASAAEDLGLNLEEIRNCESDAGLGNGGLGRLAACFLDSMATLDVPAHGYGIRYEYGIFDQKIINGYQVEYPDEWLSKANPWEFPRPEYTVRVRFGGHTYMFNDTKGRLRVKWVDTEDILAMPYDTPVCGYKSDIVNTLRLWSARSSKEFDLRYFNDGDYERAVYNKVLSENISKVLYPGDNIIRGKELRLKQEYFFTAASISDIMRRFKEDNSDIRIFANQASIQLNDTHPSLAIVELLRILIDEENLDWDTAWDIVINTFAYTNHTVMPEALECWPVRLFEKLLPRHLELIYEINARFLKLISVKFPGDVGRLNRMSIIEEGSDKRIRMAHLSIIGSHSINGVSELHSELIKQELFNDFCDVFPERFNNKTNGVTQRRWLLKSNTLLSNLITETIGDKWVTNLFQLEKLIRFKEDKAFCQKWQKIKDENKVLFSNYIKNTTGIIVDPKSMFDVQVKRIHEYKRQLLFTFYVISEYLKMKNNPKINITPRTFIIGGKAAPSYFMAKLIIKFINNVAEVINNDKLINNKIKLIFMEDYRVSLAEKIFPASDLSEQISTAGTEASGTGCMKFMMNGALTIGTYDGANIEIAESVGQENIFLFGLRVKEIRELRVNGYNQHDYINNSETLKEILHLIRINFFSQGEVDLFTPILDSIYFSDSYFICADFESYLATQNKVSALYSNKDSWVKKCIINVARSGKFSSDRTIREYAKDIWKIPVK